MNLSCPRADSAWRRACRSPRFARVISRSTSGFTAFAFAVVVSIRSWSMSSFDRFISSALRCAESRASLCLFFWWRLGSEPVYAALGGPEIQPARLQRLDDLFDRLATEVRDRVQLGLGLLEQVAHGLHARPLEAVVRPHAQLELLDQDVVHPARAGRSHAVGPEAIGPGDERRALVAQRLDAVGVGKDRQVLDEDLGRLAQRGLRVERTVGL